MAVKDFADEVVSILLQSLGLFPGGRLEGGFISFPAVTCHEARLLQSAGSRFGAAQHGCGHGQAGVVKVKPGTPVSRKGVLQAQSQLRPAPYGARGHATAVSTHSVS